jgi:adenylate cyclase
MLLGWAQIRAGEFDAAVIETGKALRLITNDGFAPVFHATHGLALLAARRFSGALTHLRTSVGPFKEHMGHYNTLISCLGHLGNREEAQRLLSFRADVLRSQLSIAVVVAALAKFAHREVFIE